MSPNTAPTSFPTSGKAQASAWLTAIPPDKKVQRWSLTDQEILVGRPEGQEVPGKLTVTGDPMLSRRHFWVHWNGQSLRVRRCPEARNPIFFQGQEREEFELAAGQHFVVGSTDFQVLLDQSSEPPTPAREFTMAHSSRESARDRQARECLHALTRLLPSLRRATDEDSLWGAALEVLAGLLPRVSCIMVLKVDRARLEAGEDDFYAVIKSYQPFASRTLPPSRRLLKAAFQQNETALHLWEASGGGEGLTVQAQVTWALAGPVPAGPGNDYALYAWGGEVGSTLVSTGEDQPGQQERTLVDLIAETLAHYLVLRVMHQLEGQVGQFFSPALRKVLLQQGSAEILQPARRTVTVLFFDLRGFSKATEKAEGGDRDSQAIEQILKHHDALTEVMTMVTGCVFEEEGIVVDYQGDAMLACWGAPISCEDHAHRAIRTAQRILQKVYALELPFGTAAPGGRRQLLRCGMGIGCGEVVAGQIGARDQIKYGVMGRVVNQASRLEGLTKYIGVPVLMTAEIRRNLPSDVLCRRVGRIRPAGMQDAVELHELVVPVELGGSGLSPVEVTAYEEGEARFSQGNFLEALSSLRQVPVEDPVGSFLTRRTYQLMDEGPPDNWEGVLEFKSK
ncbi:MAG: adenylate/guanylate cyclase domain-containing protein [Candidatus Eremiobacterota bacterium]